MAVDVDFATSCRWVFAGWEVKGISRYHKGRVRERIVEGDDQRGVVEVGYDGSSRACYTLALIPGAGSARRRRSCQGGELQIRGGLWGKMAGYARAAAAKNGKSSPLGLSLTRPCTGRVSTWETGWCTGPSWAAFQQSSHSIIESLRAPKESPHAWYWVLAGLIW